ncbi:hypothetical protein Q9Q99_04630 [Curtobacterium flaccumfaciens]|nr:hypothetical protein Q9Q99_04630 [Curtobacterium flaccumfaciens]
MSLGTVAMIAIAATTMVGLVGLAGPAQADPAFSVSGTLTGKPSATAAAVPLAGVEVYLSGLAGNYVSAYAYTDAAGHWSISEIDDHSSDADDVPLAAGSYTVQFNCATTGRSSCNHDYVVEYLGHTLLSSDSTKVTLTAAHPTAAADDELARGAAVSGTVTTADGTPIAGASVSAEPGGWLLEQPHDHGRRRQLHPRPTDDDERRHQRGLLRLRAPRRARFPRSGTARSGGNTPPRRVPRRRSRWSRPPRSPTSTSRCPSRRS